MKYHDRVFRLTNVRAGHERYYLDQVALGTEPAGRWLGGLCPELGLAGEVRAEDLRLLLDSRHPGTGERLRTRPSSVRARDLTVTEPKSVSVLWALAGAEVARALEDAHAEALREACGYLERGALQLGDGSRAEGMAAAVFPHRTSRAADPHLHTHVVVANLGRSDDDYRALDGLVISAQARTAGRLYQAHLRHAVSARLGLAWGQVDNGVAQLEAVPAELRRVFSRRRTQVEEGMARHHGASARSARLAALVDRPEREAVDPARLRAEWKERARQAGYPPEALVPPGVREQVVSDPSRSRVGRDDRSAGPDGAGRHGSSASPDLADLGLDSRSSFGRAEVLEALGDRARQGQPIDRLEREADRLLASAETVPLGGPTPLRRRDVVRTASATVLVRTDLARWHARSAADAERRLGEAARRGLDAHCAVVPLPILGSGDEGIDRAVSSLLTSGQGVQLVDSGPGWRRDSVLAGACRGWTEAGLRVMVAAEGPTAADLQSATAQPVNDPRSVIDGLSRLRGGGPAVVVLAGAEASPSRSLADLAEATERLGAKLVLVGEPGPLPDVDRAGGWRAAQRAVGSLRLGREAPAVAPRLSAGDVLRPAPWLVLAESPELVRHHLVTDWMGSPPGAAMVASRRVDIDELNGRARAALLAQGRLGPEASLPGLQASRPARQWDQLVVGRAGPAARRAGLVPGATFRLDGDHLASASGARWQLDRLPLEIELRYAYARTPYQAWRSGASPLLVLGRPPGDGPRPERSRYYTVGPSRTRAAEQTVGPSRTRAAEQTVGPSRTRAAEQTVGPSRTRATEQTLAEGAWVASGYDRSRPRGPRERDRDRSRGRG